MNIDNHGDGRDIPLLVEEGIRSTQAFVALTGNAETNIPYDLIASLVRKQLDEGGNCFGTTELWLIRKSATRPTTSRRT